MSNFEKPTKGIDQSGSTEKKPKKAARFMTPKEVLSFVIESTKVDRTMADTKDVLAEETEELSVNEKGETEEAA
ncbi:hypothetical protein K8R42_05405 [bacterium]|nr:hypothetical protein [bacterium]